MFTASLFEAYQQLGEHSALELRRSMLRTEIAKCAKPLVDAAFPLSKELCKAFMEMEPDLENDFPKLGQYLQSVINNPDAINQLVPLADVKNELDLANITPV